MRKYFLCLIALLAFAAFAYAKAPDMSVMGVGATITFPNGWYNHQIDYFNWIDSSSEITIHSCFYELKGVQYDMTNCNPGSVTFNSSLLDSNYLLKLWYNFSYDAEPGVNYLYIAGINAFYIDTLSPQITIVGPENKSYNNTVTGLYYTINEANPSSCWYSNDNGQNNHSITCGDNVTSLTSNEGSNIWMVCAKDIVNHESCDTVAFWVDSITPSIQFNLGTTETGDHRQDWIFVNVTCSDTNKESVILNINGTDIAFDKNYSDVYWSTETLSDGIYNFYAYCSDSIGHSNQTETRTVTLDTTAPIVTLTSPYNNQPFAFDQNITFNFNVSEANPYACDLILNGDTYRTNFNNGDTLSLPSGNQYMWNIQCTDSVGNSNTAPDSNTFTVLTNLTFPDGTDYTNLTLEPNISSVYFWIRNGNGSIYWTDPIDMSRGANWADYIALEFNKASVDTTTTGAYEFKDKKANITLYNITWNSPQILRDGEICSSDICTELLGSYVANVSYMFNVTSFSTYETRETPVPSYEVSGGGSSCKTNWTCTAWSTCFGNIQTRTCTKVKLSCNTYTDKPAEKQSCIEQKSVNTTQIQQAPEQPATQPQGGTGITGFITAHPASTAATLIAILGVASYFVVSRIRAKSLKPEPAKTGGKEGVSWITSKSAEKVDSV
jgi:hypothetical protein